MPADDDEILQPGITVKGGLETLRKYLGMWIAIDQDREIRASGTNSGDVLRAAWAEGIKEPELLFVPRHRFVGIGR